MKRGSYDLCAEVRRGLTLRHMGRQGRDKITVPAPMSEPDVTRFPGGSPIRISESRDGHGRKDERAQRRGPLTA